MKKVVSHLYMRTSICRFMCIIKYMYNFVYVFTFIFMHTSVCICVHVCTQSYNELKVLCINTFLELGKMLHSNYRQKIHVLKIEPRTLHMQR